MSVFAERGYAGASIAEIAKGAGVAGSVIYDHFPSKAALHIELLENQGDAVIAYSAQALKDEPADQLTRRTISAFFEFVERHPFAWRMLFRDPPADPDIAAAHRRVQDRATQAIAALFATQAELHTSVSLPRAQVNEMLGETAKSAINGLAGWWWEHPEIPRSAVVGLAQDLLWTGLERLATIA